MLDEVRKANKLKMETVKKNLEKRKIIAHYCETGEEAAQKVLDIIQDNSVVSWGGSATINTLGIKPKLAERDLTTIDPYSTKDPVESFERRRQSLTADYFLMSSNAVTMDGELVNLDGTSNRVAALCFGPKKVVIVIGANKIVRDHEAALNRARLDAAVPNALRLNKKTPCSATGICGDCTSDDCLCCNIVTTRFCSNPGRLEVILVNEDLGY
ncbi:lactate utilization protein [Sinanaerobacter chloroacetimidivorans]|nr:lactate utilization protein [Sinanaerobacter chloroacetimidivorans]